jgi:hypothetical protein
MPHLLEQVIRTIVADHTLHAKWLNSLSMMENTGARKIMRSEHPVKTDIIILKHAAEEARHAFYLKKQISRLGRNLCPDYSFEYLLAPIGSYLYLRKLDAAVSRILKDELDMMADHLHMGAYLLVTYAIEVRAEMLYKIYQDELSHAGSKVNVKSIIAEEDSHLAEMTAMLKTFDQRLNDKVASICETEEKLFNEWMLQVEHEVAKLAVHVA